MMRVCNCSSERHASCKMLFDIHTPVCVLDIGYTVSQSLITEDNRYGFCRFMFGCSNVQSIPRFATVADDQSGKYPDLTFDYFSYLLFN